jgi:hypothetical protein
VPTLDDYADQDVWVAWQNRNGQKIPVDPNTGEPARSNDPSTWVTRDEAAAWAEENDADGIGIMLTRIGDFYLIGFDYDTCLNPETGEITAGASEFSERNPTYMEVSPGGFGLKGFHLLHADDMAALTRLTGGKTGRKFVLGQGKHCEAIELYHSARYFTVTGNAYNGISELSVLEIPELEYLINVLGPRLVAEAQAARDEKKARDETRSGYVYRLVLDLVRQGCDKDEVREAILTDTTPEIADWAKDHTADGTIEREIENAFNNATKRIAEEEKEDALPLFPPMPPADPYPIEALGPKLAPAAKAMARKIQVPVSMAAQSILAASSTVAAMHIDVRMPMGQTRPPSLSTITIAVSGSRKTSLDKEAMRPLHRREQVLREERDRLMKAWKVERTVWRAEQRKYENDKRLTIEARRQALAELGPEPEKPLEHRLTIGDITPEGLRKHWANMHPSLIFNTSEGGTFTAGHAMNQDNKLKTAATLSSLWDGILPQPLRAGDEEPPDLAGRRLALNIFLQPDIAEAFLMDKELLDQGLLSRILIAHVENLAGTRLYKELDIDDEETIKAYSHHMLTLMERPPALMQGKRNELDPPALTLSVEAHNIYVAFHDHIEKRSGKGESLAAISDFASKAAEHAVRIAGTLSYIEDPDASEISADVMGRAIELADWYVGETCRLRRTGIPSADLQRAEELLQWLQAQPEGLIPFRDILRMGPPTTRLKAPAERALAQLKAHRWLTEKTVGRQRMIQIKPRAPQ